MAEASLTAGIAVAPTDVAGAHCLAEAIGGLYGHPHGCCCANSMPPVMEYNLPVSAGKYARLANAFGIASGGRSDSETCPAGHRTDPPAQPRPGCADHARTHPPRGPEPSGARKQSRTPAPPPIRGAPTRRRSPPCSPARSVPDPGGLGDGTIQKPGLPEPGAPGAP
jgi:hypothetical protein